MPVEEYIKLIKKAYAVGNATEHTYRGYLHDLIEELASGITATNEPKHIRCGAPDYILTRKGIPVGYIETKDIGADLQIDDKSDQMRRYKSSLDNLILTDYLDFWFFRHGEKVFEIKIGGSDKDKIKSYDDNFASFEEHIRDFCAFEAASIKTAQQLAKMMAQKARMMEQVVANALREEDSSLREQHQAFQRILIHDLDEKTFADIYAQTVAYGLFAARLHDTTPEDFSRQEARELIPRSNPFLRSLFDYISGAELDSRVIWIVDDLVEIFRAADLPEIMKNFGKMTGKDDPFLHFYETFLAEYDPKLREMRGVYYTPEPVVDFIVRAVDDVLKQKFGLAEGLADTSKVMVKIEVQDAKPGQSAAAEKEFHRVQILDPATGTGTFLAEIVKLIFKRFEHQRGAWSPYVESHLLPRLNGFELLMASYTVCHLKLEMLLRETGFHPSDEVQRLKVFLTNSLEDAQPEQYSGLAGFLSREAAQADALKKDTPVMVVLGNPPYSGHSANKGKWIESLIGDYKKEPGGGKLDEKNPKWLNDDYVKFIRYGQYFIEKNGQGVLAFINNHGFLDNPTFRGMRWSLLSAFDEIYVLDLHGNSKKKEKAPGGGKDENVFDIQQGVSVNLFVKTGPKKDGAPARVFHSDLYGLRQAKYDALRTHSLSTAGFAEILPQAPMYFFVPKDFELAEKYGAGFSIAELFPVNSVGIVTARDEFVIDDRKEALESRIKDFFKSDAATLKTRYGLHENKSWIIEHVQRKSKSFSPNYIRSISYRPFDNKWLYYDLNFIERGRHEVMRHFLAGENVGLSWIRPMSSNYEFSIFISSFIIDQCYAGNKSAGAGISYLAPLYLYPEGGDLYAGGKRTANLDAGIVMKIAEAAGLTYSEESNGSLDTNPVTSSGNSPENRTFTPQDVLDYVYAVLHSPSYREKYREFLKVDFPRVPYPKDGKTFRTLAGFGRSLRELHLLESPDVKKFITGYPIAGDNGVEKIEYRGGKVWINDRQYFDGVPLDAWEFFIGGYQPAQKWLKDRKGRMLAFDDISHYQEMIAALSGTIRLMKEIDGTAKGL